MDCRAKRPFSTCSEVLLNSPRALLVETYSELSPASSARPMATAIISSIKDMPA
jgi:hypothetical protein